MTRRWSVLFLVVLLATLMPATTLAADPVVDWTRQFGTSGDDSAWGIAVEDDGRIAVAGNTTGTLPGQTSRGSGDAFVQVHQSNGTVAWTRQFGTSGGDYAYGIAVGKDGDIVVAGRTEGSFPGQTRRGYDDAFVRSYRPDGTVAWTRQFGPGDNDSAVGVGVDDNRRVYVAGWTGGTFPGQASRPGYADAFVRKYRPDGRIAWTRQFGTTWDEMTTGLAVAGNGRVAVVGFAVDSSGDDSRAFVRVYRPDGRVAWTRQFGTRRWDYAEGVAVDGKGRVYVAGSTEGTLPGQTHHGGDDAFVRAYRPDGRVAWTRQFGTGGNDWTGGIAVDASGRIHVVGGTDGTFPGLTKEGDVDAFVRIYEPDGRVAWTEQFGTSEWDEAHGVGVDGSGRIAIAGSTGGTFPGQASEGASDAFVRVYVEP